MSKKIAILGSTYRFEIFLKGVANTGDFVHVISKESLRGHEISSAVYLKGWAQAYEDHLGIMLAVQSRIR